MRTRDGPFLRSPDSRDVGILHLQFIVCFWMINMTPIGVEQKRLSNINTNS